MKELNIPVWVMEPLRGGNLIKIADKHKEALQKLHPGRSVAEWSYRFLQSFEGVTVTLSGASSLEQLQENIKAFETWEPLSGEEMRGLLEVGGDIIKDETLPCTACRYCTAHCPQGLDIPHLLSLYNELLYSGGFMVPRSLGLLPPEKQPSACIGCHACEAVCPQQIKIAEAMTDFAVVHKNHLFATRP